MIIDPIPVEVYAEAGLFREVNASVGFHVERMLHEPKAEYGVMHFEHGRVSRGAGHVKIGDVEQGGVGGVDLEVESEEFAGGHRFAQTGDAALDEDVAPSHGHAAPEEEVLQVCQPHRLGREDRRAQDGNEMVIVFELLFGQRLLGERPRRGRGRLRLS